MKIFHMEELGHNISRYKIETYDTFFVGASGRVY